MRGVCKVCGCTDMDPCFNPDYGNCWWVDDSHELCSHCADKDIADDPRTEHCVNSKNGMMDDDEYICVDATGLHPEGVSPCDYCEREPCLGVEICEDEYGQDCYFIRRMDGDEAQALFEMIHGAGIIERRIFSRGLTDLTRKPADKLERKKNESIHIRKNRRGGHQR